MFTAQGLYGAQPQAPSQGVAAAIQPAGITTDKEGLSALIDVRNPLVFFGGLLAITCGLIGASGSVKLGKATFRASAGKD
jgi:hypothetical protein